MFGFALGFGEGFDSVLGVQNFLAFEKLGDGEDLQARIAAGKLLGLVEARRGGFRKHGLGGLAQRDECADRSFLAINHSR